VAKALEDSHDRFARVREKRVADARYEERDPQGSRTLRARLRMLIDATVLASPSLPIRRGRRLASPSKPKASSTDVRLKGEPLRLAVTTGLAGIRVEV